MELRESTEQPLPTLDMSISILYSLRHISNSMNRRYRYKLETDIHVWCSSIESWKSAIVNDDIFLISRLIDVFLSRSLYIDATLIDSIYLLESKIGLYPHYIISLCNLHNSKGVFNYIMSISIFRDRISKYIEEEDIQISHLIGLSE